MTHGEIRVADTVWSRPAQILPFLAWMLSGRAKDFKIDVERQAEVPHALIDKNTLSQTYEGCC